MYLKNLILLNRIISTAIGAAFQNAIVPRRCKTNAVYTSDPDIDLTSNESYLVIHQCKSSLILLRMHYVLKNTVGEIIA
jgi:hypothetical protein